MGGHNCGEVASEDALTNLRFFFDDLPLNMSEGELRQAMDNWLKSMCLAVEAKGKEDPIYRGMGTTLVAFAYFNNDFYWMNCGDSRLYRLRNGQLTQLTTDHSLNNLHGEKRHSNILTNCIGAGCRNSYMDFFEFTDNFLTGDTFMLCSDGLNDMVPDNKICQLMNNGANANQLCDAAIEAGGFDNVSVCMFTIQ